MSSKLHRGGTPGAQSIAWPSVGAAAFQPAASPTALPTPPRETAAQEELQAKIKGLERQLEERAQLAYQQGLQEGDTVARQQLGQQVGSTVTRLAHGIEQIAGLRQRFRHEAEADVVKLAVAIARRVLHRELSVDPGAVLGIVKAALEKLDSRELHRIRIHPDSAPALLQQLQQIGLPSRVEVVADPGLERGAVLFDTARGALDASVETQLSEIDRGFTDLVNHPQ